MNFANKSSNMAELYKVSKIIPITKSISLSHAKFMWKIAHKDISQSIYDIFDNNGNMWQT